MLGIWLVGASGTGKTTLARALAKQLDWPLFESRTSEIMAQHGGEEALNADPGKRDEFQQAVFVAAVRKMAEADGCGHNFVADRAFDCLAYTADQARNLAGLAGPDNLRQLAGMLKDRPGRTNLVLFLRPCPALNERAIREDGGRRADYLDWSYVNRVDGVLQFLLEQQQVPYVPVGPGTLRDRLRLAQRLIQLASRADRAAPERPPLTGVIGVSPRPAGEPLEVTIGEGLG